jgi:EmrB/QacA subfamily drug resistance transporter
MGSWSRGQIAVLLTVGLGTFMAALDGSVTNTVLPLISADFQAGLSTVEWVVMAYLLTTGSLVLTYGRMGDLFGQRRMYMAGVAIFTLGSLSCALSPSIGFMIGSRVLQASGAGMMMALGPGILTRSFPASQRGQVLGMQGTMTYLGLMVGPVLGGNLAALFGWRSAFAINLPIGAAMFLLAYLSVQEHASPEIKEGFDLPGSLLLFVGLGSFLLVLSKGEEWGWTSVATLVLALVSVGGMAAFILRELTYTWPVLNLRMFKNWSLSSATASAFLNYMGVYTVLFMMPYFMITGLGFSPAVAGSTLTAMPMLMALTTPLSGWLSDRIGPKLPATAGMVLLSLGLALLSGLGRNSLPPDVLWRLAITGLGIGLFVSPNNSAIMGSVPPSAQGVAGGLVATARTVGMVSGVAVVSAVFAVRSSLYRSLGLAQEAAFMAAFHDAMLAMALITALGIFFSFSRDLRSSALALSGQRR